MTDVITMSQTVVPSRLQASKSRGSIAVIIPVLDAHARSHMRQPISVAAYQTAFDWKRMTWQSHSSVPRERSGDLTSPRPWLETDSTGPIV